MFIHELKASGLLSFGPRGIDLPMQPLNVLIGPNGAGKSNLLELLNLLRHAPSELAQPMNKDGVGEWLWKGDASANEATLEVTVGNPADASLVHHCLAFTNRRGRPWITRESVKHLAEEPTSTNTAASYELSGEDHVFHRSSAAAITEPAAQLPTSDTGKRLGDRRGRDSGQTPDVNVAESVSISDSFSITARQPRSSPERSVLHDVRNPRQHPELYCLQEHYPRVQLYRDWAFGPSASMRWNQSTHARADFLSEDGSNLVPLLTNFRGEERRLFVDALKELFDGIVDIALPVSSGAVSLFLEERGGKQIPASRLSDGTLRYLCLLSVLLHPTPPPLIAIEEPELGLHPDAIARVAELLVEATERTQIIITTHSRMLVDALSEHPSSIVVCEQQHGESTFERLDDERLAAWLKDYSLGELWRSGELGGNRW
ncbi:MAG: AAA family ATPase [Gammaproteobacteria bacterium]|nr:AAA family ATPase [Gammaproteobacteria bacterium]MDE0273912.1 AAA family ATPase [Gammaproteobacteria bacterium]